LEPPEIWSSLRQINKLWGTPVDVWKTITALIDMRSFSNIWYWIVLAVAWSSASHWVLGVPFDMVLRARRKGGAAEEALVLMTRLSTQRLLLIGREGGMILAVVASFLLSSLAVLGFGYGYELAQGMALILVPMVAVGLLSLRAAARLEPVLCAGPEAVVVMHALSKHRMAVQAIGMVAITVTAMWGMLQNMHFATFG